MLPAWIPASWTMCCRWIWDTRLTALFPGLPRWAGTRKVKPIWILLKQETVSGNGINWAICKSAPRSRQITMPAPHHSLFYRPDALPAAQPTASKHWRDRIWEWVNIKPDVSDFSDAAATITAQNTGSSAIAEGPSNAPCQLKQCEMSQKCSSNCIW